MKKLLSIVMAMIFAMQLSAQTVVVAGDTLSNQVSEYFPMYHCYHDSYTQMLYKAEELQAGGITNISFYCVAGGFNEGTIKIYMKEVADNTLSGIIPGTDYTEVYSGADITTTGWATFNFNAPFIYTGTSNLLVTVIRDGSAYNCGAVLYKVSTVSNTVYTVYDDGVSFNVASMPSGYSTGGEYRPVAKFEFANLEGFCYPPTNLTVETTSITTNEATLSWNTFNGTTTQFGLAYKSTTEEEWNTVSENISDSSYTITGLDSYTRYQVKVWSICDDEISLEKMTEFVTLPASELCVNAPYSQNFDDTNSVSEWHFLNNTPNQWHIGSAVNNTYTEDGLLTTGNALYISNDAGVTNAYTTNTICTSHAYILVNIEEGNYYGVSFDVKQVGESNTYALDDYLAVSLLPLEEELGANLPFENIIIGEVSSTDNQWQRINIPFPNDLSPTVYKLVFSWHNDDVFGYNPPAAIDNVTLTSTSCARVNDFEVSMEDAGGSVTLNIAVIDSINNSAEYLVEYRYSGDTAWHSVQSNSPVVVTGVPYSSKFDYRVISNCSGDFAVASDMFTEWTLCHSTSNFPYVENFDNNIILPVQDSSRANYQSFHCWYNVNGGSSYYYWHTLFHGFGVDSTNALFFSGSYSSEAIEFSDWLISPIFELTGNERLNFQYRKISLVNPPVIEVYAMNVSETDYASMADTSNFTLIASINTQEIEVGEYNMVEIFLNQCVGNTRIALAIRQKTDSFYIDNFAISEIPPCSNVYGFSPQPGNQVVYINYNTENITNAGVIVAYDEIEEGEEFNLANATSVTIPANADLPYVIEGITTGATYAFVAQQACGGNWTDTIILTIPSAHIPPVSFDFDTPETTPELTITTNNQTVRWFVGTAENNTIDTLGNLTTGGRALYISADNGATAGYNNTRTEAIASMLIALNTGLETYISFDYKVNGEGSLSYGDDYMSVYLVPFGSTRSPHHLLAEYLLETDSWRRFEITLPSSYYGLYNLEFVWKNNTYEVFLPGAIVDNIKIAQIPCFSEAVEYEVSSIEIEEGVAAFMVNLTDQVNEGATYTIRYKESSATEYTEINGLTISDFPYVISDGIDFQTTYNFQVLLLCSGEEILLEVGTQTITTPCQLISSIWFEDFSENIFAAPSCWGRYNGMMPESGIIAFSDLIPATLHWSVDNITSGGVTSNALNANVYGSYFKNWVISPTVDLSNESTIQQISFSVALREYGHDAPPESALDDRFMMLISLDNGDTWNIANGLVFADGDSDTIHNFSGLTNQYQRFAYKLVDENGEPLTDQIKFAFYAESTITNGNNELIIDDISLEPWSECQVPYGIRVYSITDHSAIVSFNTWGDATIWEYVLVEGVGENANLDSATPIQIGTIDSIAFTGLNPITEHTFAIRSICEDSFSPWVKVTFTTVPIPIVLGEVTTQAATEVSNTSATLNGTLVSAGNSESPTLGFALSTLTNFTLEDADVQNITATLNANGFSQVVTGLEEGQTYFFRAYITNEAGTAYGAVETFTLVSLEEATANSLQVSLYPNPASKQAILQLEGLTSDAKIIISDIQGRILIKDTIKANEKHYTINLSNIASGVYYIRIVAEETINTQKLIVE